MNSPFATLSKGKDRIKSAFSKKGSDKSEAEILQERKDAFLSSHALAEKRVAIVRKTPGADRSAKVKELVKGVGDFSDQVKKQGEDAKDVAEVELACKNLSKIYDKANEAVTACTGPNMDAFEKAREKARGRIGDMRQLPGAATFLPLQSRITAADDVLNTAVRLAREAVNAEEVKTQTDALGIIAKLKLEAKQQSNKYLANAPENIAEFEKKRKSTSDRLAEVRSLRGASDDPETANRLQNADKILDDITKKAREAKTPEQVTEQIKRLESIETLAKSVESLSKEVKQRAKGDVKALPKYNEMLIEAEKARDALMDIGVASKEYQALTNLIAASKKTLADKGAGQALADLSTYSNFVKQAEEKQDALKNKVPPVAVLKIVAQLSPLLVQLEKVAPEYLAKMHDDEKDRMVYLSQTPATEAEAVTGLEALVVTVQKDLEVVQAQKADAEKKVKDFETAKDKLVSTGYREDFFTVATQLGKQAAELDIPARDWGRAVERLDNAIALVTKIETAQQDGKAEWDKCNAKRQEMRKLASSLLSWPPLVSAANKLLAALNELDTQLQTTGDYAACQANYLAMDLVAMAADLQEAVDETPDMPPLESLKDLSKGYAEADKAFWEVNTKIGNRFMFMERDPECGADPKGSKLYVELMQVETGWTAAKNKPQANAKPEEVVLPYIERLEKILKTCDDLLKDKKKLREFGKEAEIFDSQQEDGLMAKAVPAMINQLERNGVALPSQRKTLDDLMQPGVSAEKRGEGLLKLKEELEGLVDANKRLEQGRVKETQAAVKKGVTDPLNRIKGRHREFQDYQKILETEANDIDAMTNSDDPYFLKTARLETITLAKKVVVVDPEQRGDQGARYKAVEELWDKLRKMLAGDMKELMPTTHAKMRTELAKRIGASRKMPPLEALAESKKAEPLIQAAFDRLPTVRVEINKYKARKERLEKQWAQVKKETKTRVTDRVTEFANSFEVRLGEADAALKEENGFRRANVILKGLEDKLRAVETSGDPRAALQKMDAAVAQDQRAIRDLARGFEEELKYYKETTIPRARKIIRERAAAQKSLAEKVGDKITGALSKFTETGVGGTDLDEELLDSLETTARNAPKPVQSYLNMISTTTIGAAKTPELSVAQAAFKAARGMISSATRTVDALKTTVGGVDMTVTEDLKKVQGNWVLQTQNYAKIVREIAAAIREAAQNDPDEEVKAAAAKAAKTVTDAAAAFHASAFQSEFTLLENKDATKEAKLSAREKALTTMRAYRKILLSHPVHKQLADQANPFAQGEAMRNAARGILVGLKRIELETLVK